MARAGCPESAVRCKAARPRRYVSSIESGWVMRTWGTAAMSLARIARA